jgi:hypothetical protein
MLPRPLTGLPEGNVGLWKEIAFGRKLGGHIVIRRQMKRKISKNAVLEHLGQVPGVPIYTGWRKKKYTRLISYSEKTISVASLK